MEDAERLESELRSYRPAGYEAFPASFIWPRYEGACVGNLPASIAHALGAEMPVPLPGLRASLMDALFPGVWRVVFILVDALGWLQLRSVMKRNPGTALERLGAAGRLVPMTTSFLSTTNSVLSTIWTGYPPRQHGLLAFLMFLREWLMAVESLGFSAAQEPFAGTLLRWGFEPEAFMPVPGLAQHLAAQSIPTYGVIYRGYTTTPLSRMNYRGFAEVKSHLTASDFWLEMRRTLHAHRQERCLIAGYWSAVDSLAHSFGPYDESGEVETLAVSSLMESIFLDRLTPEDREGTLFLLTADHGQITVPPESLVLLSDHPELRDRLLMPPLGESRVPFFHVRHGELEAVWDYLNDRFGDRFLFMRQGDVIDAGLLGPGPDHPELRHRLGDILGIATGDAAFERGAQVPAKMLGRHGGLTAEEMLVPLLAARLDA